MCKSKRQFLSEEEGVHHLKWFHKSRLFSENPGRFLKVQCRICEADMTSRHQAAVNCHFLTSHPFEKFATEEDLLEEQSSNEVEKQEASKDVTPLTGKQSLDQNMNIDSAINLGSYQDSIYRTDQNQESFFEKGNGNCDNYNDEVSEKTMNDVTEVKEKMDMGKTTNNKGNEGNEDEDDIDIPEVCEVRFNNRNVFDFVERIRKEVSLEKERENVENMKEKSPSQLPNQPAPNHSSTKNEREKEINQNQRDTYSGVLVPLPFVPFSLKANGYRCTVGCFKTYEYDSNKFVIHRESKFHRENYGRLFKKNNFEHFPDGCHFDERKPVCCWCNEVCVSFQSLDLHMRQHRFPEKVLDISKDEYCNICKIPILTSRAVHEARHSVSVAVKDTFPCVLCCHQVYRDDINKHCGDAHRQEYFRCRILGCHQQYLYGNQMIKHQRLFHNGSEKYVSRQSCHFPVHFVRIQCSSCLFHLLGRNNTEQMIEHIMYEHKHSHETGPQEGIEYLCRLCNYKGDSYQEVDDHAEKHLEGKTFMYDFNTDETIKNRYFKNSKKSNKSFFMLRN